MDEHLRANLANWDERAGAHAASAFYGVAGLAQDPSALSSTVRFDRARLGDLTGLDTVHLQCHIGTDTLSLHRLGARVTGLDFSPRALAEARALADRAGARIEYVQATVADAARALGTGRFDLVYTGLGALGWLPDIRGWAQVVADLLRPGGRLFLREGHPVLWALADTTQAGDPVRLEHPYFGQPEPQRWDEPGTYADTDQEFTNTVTYEWNRGLGEIVTALLDAGLTLTGLTEHDSVPWEALPGVMTRDDGGEWRLADRPERLPASYTLRAVKA